MTGDFPGKSRMIAELVYAKNAVRLLQLLQYTTREGSKSLMMKTFEILIANIARAMRAHAESQNEALPKSQRDFHAGRRESYLQNVAMIAGLEVKDIRNFVISEKVPAKKKSKKTEDQTTRIELTSPRVSSPNLNIGYPRYRV